MMEADSTTFDTQKSNNITYFPFSVEPQNLKQYLNLVHTEGYGTVDQKLVNALQGFGLIPESITFPKQTPECKLIIKPARVIDRVQWLCEHCNTKLSIRKNTFFHRLPCSLLQALQVILAWCEDADYDAVAQHFDLKPKAVCAVYDKLEQLASARQRRWRLGGGGGDGGGGGGDGGGGGGDGGGGGGVVLGAMFPAVAAAAPDSTRPHSHAVLMLCDTLHVPTRYCLHVIKEDPKRPSNGNLDDKKTLAQISECVSWRVSPRAPLVLAHAAAPRARPLHALLARVDADTREFLSERIWRQAVALCEASRDLCPAGAGAGAGAGTGTGAGTGAGAGTGTGAVQLYLDVSSYRLAHRRGLYGHMLRVIAECCTGK